MAKERSREDRQNVLHKETDQVAIDSDGGVSSKAHSRANDGTPNYDKML